MDYQRPNHTATDAELSAAESSEYLYLKLFAALVLLAVVVAAVVFGMQISRSMQVAPPAPSAAAVAPPAPTASTQAPATGSAAAQAPSAAGAAPSMAPATATPTAFAPPAATAIPEGPMGDVIRKGEQIFLHTGTNAKAFVGNTLNCVNCHLDAGRQANAAPMWGAYVMYPAYRSKTKSVDDFEERLRGCFMYSMNGKAPPRGDDVLVALQAYAYWMSKGAPVGEKLPGAGFPKLDKPALKADYARGQKVYEAQCVLCHGANGEGQRSGDVQVFPPLWGAQSYNWGAGMGDINNAAGFIKANMPLSKGNSLSDQEAWDVATYIDSQERPQDPRFTGDVASTRKQFHDSEMSMYGQTVNGKLLGALPLKK